jgi:hypothetical protein
MHLTPMTVLVIIFSHTMNSGDKVCLDALAVLAHKDLLREAGKALRHDDVKDDAGSDGGGAALCRNRVKFWFIKNYMSPQMKRFLPLMAQHYSFEFEFVTYKWPTWLHKQVLAYVKLFWELL